MKDNYMLTKDAKDVKLYEDSDFVMDKVQQVEYFLNNCFNLDYFRESSTSGLPLDEIEDILVDCEEIVKVWDKVKAADEMLDTYLHETEDRYLRGDLAYALPKTKSVLWMVEDVAEFIIERAENLFPYINPLGASFETRNGVKAFWSADTSS